MKSRKRASKYSSMNKYIRALYTKNKEDINNALELRLGHLPNNAFNAFKSIYEDEFNKYALKKAGEHNLYSYLLIKEDESIASGKSPKPFQLLNKLLSDSGKRKIAVPYKSILKQTSLALTSRDYRSGLGILNMLKNKPEMFKSLRKKTGWNISIDPHRISFLRFNQSQTIDDDGEEVKLDENYISYVGLKGNYFFKIVGSHKKIDSADITTYKIIETSPEEALKDSKFNFVSNVRDSLDAMDYTNMDATKLVSKDIPISFKKFKHIYMGVKEHVI